MAQNDGTAATGKGSWWRGGVLYQIYPRSFYDSNGDGIGDLNGITEKLDYIASLGVDGVWISPFFTSPMKDFGYDVADYCDIDPIFGTLEDFDRMLEGMHRRGLKLVIDVVLNHSSDQHPWFHASRQSRDNPKSDWYVWADPKEDGGPPNNWLSVFGGPAWTYDTKRGQYYLHQFLKEQPDLNVRNPEVQDALLGVIKWWLDRGVDGFRLDVLNHCIQDEQLRDNPPNPNIDRKTAGKDRNNHPYYWQSHVYDRSRPENLQFVERLRALTDQYPDRMMVAEIYDDDPVGRSAEYTHGDRRVHTAYNFALLQDGVFNPADIRAIITAYQQNAESWPAWSFSNHDMRRTATRWAADGRQADATQVKMMLAMLASLRGTIFMYEGEELGLPEADVPFERLRDPYGIFLWPEDKGRDGCRTPMPWVSNAPHAGFSTAPESWLPVPAEHQLLAVDSQEANVGAPLHAARRLVGLRRATPDLREGDMRFVDGLPANVLGFWSGGVLCLFILSGEESACTLDGRLLKLELEDITGTETDGHIGLPAWGFWLGRRG
jgi:alpha-glucosidase